MNVSFWVITKYRSFFRNTNEWPYLLTISTISKERKREKSDETNSEKINSLAASGHCATLSDPYLDQSQFMIDYPTSFNPVRLR